MLTPASTHVRPRVSAPLVSIRNTASMITHWWCPDSIAGCCHSRLGSAGLGWVQGVWDGKMEGPCQPQPELSGRAWLAFGGRQLGWLAGCPCRQGMHLHILGFITRFPGQHAKHP